MNREEENKLFYKNTFDEVHASDNLLRKVKYMKAENKKIVKRISKRFVCAAAALAVVGMVSSNAIAYAATGSTWIKKVMISIDGKDYEVEKTQINEDNMVLEIKDIDGSESYDFEVENNGGTGMVVFQDNSTGLELEMENERILLKSDEERIDITDNFKEGICEGDVKIKGETYHYVVTEQDGIYGLKAEKK